MPTWETFLNDTLIPGAINIAWKLVAAALLMIVGTLIIKFVMKRLKKGRLSQKLDKTVHHFVLSFVRIALYVLLLVMVVATLGVPMASIIAVIGSVGLAVSLAVQGTLANLASGIMILVFKPFRSMFFNIEFQISHNRCSQRTCTKCQKLFLILFTLRKNPSVKIQNRFENKFQFFV